MSRKKPHILEDNEWHNYAWVYNNGKAKLYMDGKLYTRREGITLEYWYKNSAKSMADFLDDMRLSKIARKIRVRK
jgi:hypothetical protein